MDSTTFLITVFCLIDDWLTGHRLRQRGPRPTLHDSEVLTLEIVGEFWSLDTDSGIFTFFRHYYADWFPALCQIDRTTFLRPAANLWAVKAQLWQHLLQQIEFDPTPSLVDSFPVPICRFVRARRCQRLREYARYGRDEMANPTFYGLRVHLRVCWPGVIVELRVAPANVHDLPLAVDLLAGVQGWGIAIIGVHMSESSWKSRVCACWHPTKPRATNAALGHTGWCRPVAGLRR